MKRCTEVLKIIVTFLKVRTSFFPTESEVHLCSPVYSLWQFPGCASVLQEVLPPFNLKGLTVLILFPGVPVHLERRTDHEFSGVSSGTFTDSPLYVFARSSMISFKSKLFQEHGALPGTVTCSASLAVSYLGISQHVFPHILVNSVVFFSFSASSPSHP